MHVFVHAAQVNRTDLLEYLDRTAPGELLDMQRATGVPYETIRRIKHRITRNPRLNTFEALSAYVEAKVASEKLESLKA